jgi:hypothetical protein
VARDEFVNNPVKLKGAHTLNGFFTRKPQSSRRKLARFANFYKLRCVFDYYH